MLLRDEIMSLQLVQMEDGSLPPNEYFDITSYNLRLGKEYCLIGGPQRDPRVGDSSTGTGVLRIPPFACALVSSEEVVKLPADVAGRWGLKIRPAMSGLVFQAGPQIEPGSYTRLFGLLFNLSSSERIIHYRQKLWSIDFVRLPDPITQSPLPSQPKLLMRDYTQSGLPAGSISEIYSEYRKLQRDTSARRDLGLALIMAVITLIVSIGVPVVVTQLVSNTAETVRQQQELKDRVDDLEDRVARLAPTPVANRMSPSPAASP